MVGLWGGDREPTTLNQGGKREVGEGGQAENNSSWLGLPTASGWISGGQSTSCFD